MVTGHRRSSGQPHWRSRNNVRQLSFRLGGQAVCLVGRRVLAVASIVPPAGASASAFAHILHVRSVFFGYRNCSARTCGSSGSGFNSGVWRPRLAQTVPLKHLSFSSGGIWQRRAGHFRRATTGAARQLSQSVGLKHLLFSTAASDGGALAVSGETAGVLADAYAESGCSKRWSGL